MFATIDSTERCKSHLLSMLPADEFQLLLPHLELVHNDIRQVVFERNKPIDYVYFPCTSVLSVITYMQDGTGVEVGTVGNEGFADIGLFIGSNVATDTTICQVAGDSLRMPAKYFCNAIAGDTALRRIIQRYLPAYLSQMAQSVACNRLHTIEERFARWVLLTQDRVETNEFYLTQEFLAIMLGVRRPSVSLVASEFQQAGFLTYRRGNMAILNRAGLEQAACECYGTVKSQFQRFLGVERG